MIDSKTVNEFWEKRAARVGEIEFESIGNLEQNNENLLLKVRDETEKVYSWLPSLKNLTILDLGAGVGQWSFRFAELGAKHVYAVERSKELIDIGENEKKKRALNNINFIQNSAENFTSNESFDLIFVSGLLLYLNDKQYDLVLKNIQNLISENGILLVRDSISIEKEKYIINNQYSKHLDAIYSAIYRTKNEYIDSFDKKGFSLIKDENMFPEGHVLNKYPETRLHLFMFEKIN